MPQHPTPSNPADPFDLPPPDLPDAVLEAYKKDVDRTLLRENLKLTIEERIRKAESFHASLDARRGAARHLPLEEC